MSAVQAASKAALLAVKARLLQMHFESGVGHIGGNLSCVDALVHLHLNVMREDDTFILSKGHAAGALYVTLWATGDISEAELREYHKDGTHLSAHPAARWNRKIPFATGSLGHGLSLACGVALGKRLRREPGDVYCLVGDGECQEGSIWEALMFAHHHRLENLVVLIDANGLQGFGRIADVASMSDLPRRLRGLSLQVEDIDGHDDAALDAALAKRGAGALVVVMNTIKGNGVSYMRDRLEWHYLPMDEAQYHQAVSEMYAV
jgi:transketolase